MSKKKTKQPRKTKKIEKVEVDWADEESIRAIMARELDVPIEDLSIEEDSGLSSFSEGTFYLVSTGRHEWQVAENDDAARNLAVAVVKQDLEHEPEIFEQNFIESHINLDRLRRDLTSDVEEMNRESVEDEARRRPIEFMKEHGIDIPEPTEKQLRDYAEAMSDDDNPASAILAKLEKGDAEDKWIEMGEEPEVPDNEIEKIIEEITEQQLKDPLDYLRDIYGDEAAKKAIDIAGIDIDAAAEEAVSVDGEGHFLARYDGHMHDGPGGIVWWRSN